jgi:hypothetical protein
MQTGPVPWSSTVLMHGASLTDRALVASVPYVASIRIINLITTRRRRDFVAAGTYT